MKIKQKTVLTYLDFQFRFFSYQLKREFLPNLVISPNKFNSLKTFQFQVQIKTPSYHGIIILCYRYN